MKLIDLIGKRFGKLTVIKRVKRIDSKHVYWLCKCDCGKETMVRSQHLREGKINSCGCLVGEKHSMRYTRLYRIYTNIKTRCYNEKSPNYSNYGGKGIKMCNEWEYSFTSFKTWSFANGYNDNLTIDRIDNNKGYFPENCRWVDKFVQANNKNNNIYYQFHGIKHTIGEWSRIIPINKKAVYRRLEKGNDVIDLFEKAYNMVY